MADITTAVTGSDTAGAPGVPTGAPVHQNTFREQFQLFAKFPDPKADGKLITLTKVDKWLKQAKLLDRKVINTTDTGVCFNKFRSSSINFTDFVKFIEDLAAEKNLDFNVLKDKLTLCGSPGTGTAVPAVKAA